MAVKKVERGKPVKSIGFFTVRRVPKFQGHGRERKEVGSSYDIFHAKHNVKSGFKNSQTAIDFLEKNSDNYDKKSRKFKNVEE